MRRHEPTLDPAVAAELEALEAALAGDPAAEPELAALVRDVRAEAPAMAPDFRARLDGRVAARLRQGAATAPPAVRVAASDDSRARRRRLRRRRPRRDRAERRRRLERQRRQQRRRPRRRAPPRTESSDSAKSSSGAGSGASGSSSSGSSTPQLAAPAPGPAAPAQQRRVERSTRLELTTTDVQAASDGVVRATQATGGFVQSSQVSTGDGRSTASFVLRVPTGRLDDALARLSRLGHVRSLQQSADDITNVYNGASARLAEARAERRGLLRALSKATTAAEISSLRARIADNRGTLQRDAARAQRSPQPRQLRHGRPRGDRRRAQARGAPERRIVDAGRRRARRRPRPRGQRRRGPHRPRRARPARARRRRGRLRRRRGPPPPARGGAVVLTANPYKSCNPATCRRAAVEGRSGRGNRHSLIGGISCPLPRRAARALAPPRGRPRAPRAAGRHRPGLARPQRLHGLRLEPHRLAVQRRHLRLAAGRRDPTTQLTFRRADDGQPAWSPDGRRLAFKTAQFGSNQLAVINADGTGETLLTRTFRFSEGQPAWSPDGTKLLYRRTPENPLVQNADIWVLDVAKSATDPTQPVTQSVLLRTGDERYPSYSPDGTQIVFRGDLDLAEPSGDEEIYVMNADGTNVRQLTSNADFDSAPSWSPDGTEIALREGRRRHVRAGRAGRATKEAEEKDIYVMRADGTHVRRLTDSPGARRGPGVLARRHEDRLLQRSRRPAGDLRHGRRRLEPAAADRQPGARRVARLAGAALRRPRPPGVRRRLARLRRRVERARDAGPVPRGAPDRATLERGRRRGRPARQAPRPDVHHDAAALRPDGREPAARTRRGARATSRSCGATRRGRPRRRRPRPRRSPLRKAGRAARRTTRATRAPPRRTRRSRTSSAATTRRGHAWPRRAAPFGQLSSSPCRARPGSRRGCPW